MWPNHTTSVGPSRNRRVLKDKDGRPAVARSSSRRRKESSKRHEHSTLRMIAQSVSSLPHAEEDSESEELPALPPSRPTTASPIPPPSPKVPDEGIGSSTALYRLALPLITPAALQPYLEDENQTGEHMLNKDLPVLCTPEPHMDSSQRNMSATDTVTVPESDLDSQILKARERIELSKLPDSRSIEQAPKQGSSPTYSQLQPESDRYQSNTVSFPIISVGLPTQSHNLVHPMVDSYCPSYNIGHVHKHEPHLFPQQTQSTYSPLEWQYQRGQQIMSPPNKNSLPSLDLQSSVVPLGPFDDSYDAMAIDELTFCARKIASNIEALQVHLKELLNSVENEVWNVRDLERRIIDLRQSTKTRVDDERTALIQQGAIQRDALQSKVRDLEIQIRQMEDSFLLENQTLYAQLKTATQEISGLKGALQFEARNRQFRPGPFCEKFPRYQPDGTSIPKYSKVETAQGVNSGYGTRQEGMHDTMLGQDRGLVEQYTAKVSPTEQELVLRGRHFPLKNKKILQVGDSVQMLDVQHTQLSKD